MEKVRIGDEERRKMAREDARADEVIEKIVKESIIIIRPSFSKAYLCINYTYY